MPEAVTWAYVDDRRTHRVDTLLRRGRTLEYVIVERAIGNEDPGEVFEEVHALVEPWESRVHQLALEARISQLGNYYKSAGAGWHPVRAGVARALDLEPLDLEGEGSVVEFHHYQEKEGNHAVTLIGVHEELPRGRRSLLARLDYTYPHVDSGNLQLLHPRLPPPVFRSALASQHCELRELKFEKLHRAADLGMDARSWSALKAVLETILARLIEGRLGKANEAGPHETRHDALSALEALALARRTRNASSSTARSFETEDELGPTASGVEGKKPTVMMEQLPSDILTAMNEPKLVALHARFLPPGEDARLIEEGDLAILRAMRRKREEVDPKERHLVSLLEASLLLRRALVKRTRVEPEVINRVRHARAYL